MLIHCAVLLSTGWLLVYIKQNENNIQKLLLSTKLSIYIMLRISQKGIAFTCFWRKEPRCRGGAEGQREEGEGGEKMNHRC